MTTIIIEKVVEDEFIDQGSQLSWEPVQHAPCAIVSGFRSAKHLGDKSVWTDFAGRYCQKFDLVNYCLRGIPVFL
jgi:hypothetical protein